MENKGEEFNDEEIEKLMNMLLKQFKSLDVNSDMDMLGNKPFTDFLGVSPDDMEYKTETFTDENGAKITITKLVRSNSKPQKNMTDTLNSNAEKINQLQKRLDNEIETERYEQAAETRDLINELKKNPDKVVSEVETKSDENDVWDFSE